MNAKLVSLTSAITLRSFNGTYVAIPFFAASAFAALVRGDTATLFGTLLGSSVLFGLLAANALAEMKVRPLSWCMPGQTRLAGPAILLPAVVLCLIGAALILRSPLEDTATPAVLQFGAAFLWALAAYLGSVLGVVLMRDPAIVSLLSMTLFCTVMIALAREPLHAVWLEISLALLTRPVTALVLATVVVGISYRTLGSRRLSRYLCGAPYVPLKAHDNPFKLDDYRRRVRAQAFDASAVAAYGGTTPGAGLLYNLARASSGSSLDYVIHELRLPGSRRDLLSRLLYLAVALLILSFAFSDAGRGDPLPRLVVYVAIVFTILAPGFKPRVSPLLPVSRRQHFRALLLKGVLIYLLTLAALVLVRVLAAGITSALLPGAPPTGVALTLASLPVSSMLFLALSVPAYLWGFTTFRSTIGFLGFCLAFVLLATTSSIGAHRAFVGLPYGTMLLVSAAAFLPFVGIAFKRCFRDDLLTL